VNALFGEIACILFLDKFGRRKPLIGANLMAGSTFVVAALVVYGRKQRAPELTTGLPYTVLSPNDLPLERVPMDKE
jgi:hypothetical protein